MERGRSFERFGGLCATLVGIEALVYSVAFLIALKGGIRPLLLLTHLALTLGGLLTVVVAVVLYQRFPRRFSARNKDAQIGCSAIATGVQWDPVRSRR